MNKQTITYIIIAIVIAGGGGFYGGMQYDTNRNKNQLPSNFAESRRNQNGNSTGLIGGRQLGDGLINGEILSKDASSITVKLRDGGAKIILLSANTSISKSVDGSLDDLVVGENIMVTGSANADGSLTAESISLRPTLPTLVPNP